MCNRVDFMVVQAKTITDKQPVEHYMSEIEDFENFNGSFNYRSLKTADIQETELIDNFTTYRILPESWKVTSTTLHIFFEGFTEEEVFQLTRLIMVGFNLVKEQGTLIEAITAEPNSCMRVLNYNRTRLDNEFNTMNTNTLN